MIDLAQEILSDLYRIKIPLPNNLLGFLNSYMVKGDEKVLIIDTGMNRKECSRPMFKNLEKLNVDLNKTDFFITHIHADHLGLVGKLATDSSKVYFNEPEASLISKKEKVSERMEKFFSFYRSHGFPEEELQNILERHPGPRYSVDSEVDFCVLSGGEELEIGGYTFRCIETPGHSPGHMCLYEPDEKVLFSGDHVLFDITPNITWWPVMQNALDEYLKSLEKIKNLNVNLVLPSHRSIQENLRERIEELKEHHQNRLEEVLLALEGRSKTAWEVASRITWNISDSSWEKVSPIQKWFAIGETIAHLVYLEEGENIQRFEREGRITFSPA